VPCTITQSRGSDSILITGFYVVPGATCSFNAGSAAECGCATPPCLDAAGTACALNADQTACAVADGDCTYSPAVASTDCPDNCVLAGVPGIGAGETCLVRSSCIVDNPLEVAVVTPCAAPGPYTLSGCVPVVCSAPSSVGFAVTETQLRLAAGFDVSAVCAANYEYAPPATATTVTPCTTNVPSCTGTADAVATCTGTATDSSLTCDLDAATDSTAECPAGCTFVSRRGACTGTATAECTGTATDSSLTCDLDAATDSTAECPAGCVDNRCTGIATEVAATCTADAYIPMCDLHPDTDGTDACPAGCDTLPTCDLDASTDGTATCPDGCLHTLPPTVPTCDLDAATDGSDLCPIGCTNPSAYALSGCRPIVCTMPPNLDGYTITSETNLDLGAGQFAVTGACAPNYEGTFEATACTSSGPYALSGCEPIVCSTTAGYAGYDTVREHSLDLSLGFHVEAQCALNHASSRTAAGLIPAVLATACTAGGGDYSLSCCVPHECVKPSTDSASCTSDSCPITVPGYTGGDSSALSALASDARLTVDDLGTLACAVGYSNPDDDDFVGVTFVLADLADACPASAVPVSQADCLAAAISVLPAGTAMGRATLQVGSWEGRPQGCTVQSGGDWAAHFNTALSANTGGYTPVCSAYAEARCASDGEQFSFHGCAESRCAPLVFETGVVGGYRDACTEGLRLSAFTDPSCTRRCDDGYTWQNAPSPSPAPDDATLVVTCAADALAGDAYAGGALVCAENQCAPIVFGPHVETGDVGGCADGQRLGTRTTSSCTVKCATGFAPQGILANGDSLQWQQNQGGLDLEASAAWTAAKENPTPITCPANAADGDAPLGGVICRRIESGACQPGSCDCHGVATDTSLTCDLDAATDGTDECPAGCTSDAGYTCVDLSSGGHTCNYLCDADRFLRREDMNLMPLTDPRTGPEATFYTHAGTCMPR